jgi:hypothetical protein
MQRLAESAVRAARLLEDPHLLASALSLLALEALDDSYQVAESIHQEAVEVARASGDEVFISRVV